MAKRKNPNYPPYHCFTVVACEKCGELYEPICELRHICKKQNSYPVEVKIGDTVYIIGKYIPDPSEKPRIVEAQISHIKHRQFVAYGIDDNNLGTWSFSQKHIGKTVFLTHDEAERALKEREKNAKVR